MPLVFPTNSDKKLLNFNKKLIKTNPGRIKEQCDSNLRLREKSSAGTPPSGAKTAPAKTEARGQRTEDRKRWVLASVFWHPASGLGGPAGLGFCSNSG